MSLIGVKILGNVVDYNNSASIQLDENNEPTAIGMNGKIFLPIGEQSKQQTHSNKQPLFTTEDGKDIHEGDEYWFVHNNESIYPNTASKTNGAGRASATYKYFSTEEAAKEYILINKPCSISLKEIKSCCYDDSAGGGCLYLSEEKLIQLIKSKL